MNAAQVRDAFENAKALKSACDAEVAAGRYTLVGSSFAGYVGDGYSEQVPSDKTLARQFNDACLRLSSLLDDLVANATGFGGTFCDLLDAQRKNGYRPTFRERGRPEVAVLADCYDYFAGLWGLAETSYRPERKVSSVRVPATFYHDHDERGCEPFCEPVKTTKRFVWLRLDDPGLDELLDDARHYADPDGPDELGGTGA